MTGLSSAESEKNITLWKQRVKWIVLLKSNSLFSLLNVYELMKTCSELCLMPNV